MKPFSLTTRIFCCLNICGLSATTPNDFSRAIKRLLMHPIKLALIPAIVISLAEISLRSTFQDFRGLIPIDWANHCNFVVVYFLGYAIISEDSNGFAEMLRKCRWWYFGIGLLILSVNAPVVQYGNKWFTPLYAYIARCVLRGFGEWIFILGLYSVNRSICTRSFKIIKTLREMAMPFYLTHIQISVVLVSGTFWVPYLSTFFPTIILSTLCVSVVSFLIVKSPDLIRYLFGLPSIAGKLPGDKLAGFVPLIILSCSIVILSISANLFYYMNK